jgi:hypothetical protein
VGLEGQDLGEVAEVAVGGQYCKVPARRRSADQEVSIRPLDSSRSAPIEATSSLLVVSAFQFDVRECLDVIAKGIELRLHPNARENLLSDGTDDGRPSLTNQFAKFVNDRILT